MPRFSVVVPAYNSSATIRETLEAMVAQKYSDWECVVVDDGSTDDTAAIVSEYVELDSRFKLVQQENTGTAGANNAGVRAAEADLLVICASDDYLLPNHLALMDEFIGRNPDYEIYSCNGQYMSHERREFMLVYGSDEWAVERSLSFDDALKACFYSVGAVYRRSTFDTAGGFRLGVYVDDYDLWLRAMAHGARHRYTPETLSVHRTSGFQQSASSIRVLESEIEVFESLLAACELEDEHARAVQARLQVSQSQLADANALRALEESADALLGHVIRIFGPRLGTVLIRGIHGVSWVVRPLRLARARRRATSSR